MTDQITFKTIKIDGKEYTADQLTDNARNQIININVCDQEIARLHQKLAIVQTARAAYANALKANLEEETSPEENQPNQ